MCLYYLLAGHLLGDFTLQTNTIAYKKNEDLKWILIHSLIVTFSMLIFSLPFGFKVIFLVFINGITHFSIDYLKTKINSSTPIISFICFLADQFCHLLIIYFIALFSKSNSNLIFGKNIIVFIISFLFILSFSSICIQFLLKILFNLNYKSFYIQNEKSIGNINRILVFLTFLISYYYSVVYIIILPLTFASLIIYYKLELSKWMTIKYFKVKLFLELFFSTIGFGIFELLKS